MHADSTLISVLMPVYNAEKYIGEAVDSIINQTYDNWELIICDDYSSDNTANVIQACCEGNPKIKFYRNPSNQGKIRTVNQSLAMLNGNIITIHDGDDYSHPDRFKQVIDAFENDLDVKMVGSFAEIVDDKGRFIANDTRPLSYEAILSMLQSTSPFNGATVFIKLEVIAVTALYRPFFEAFAYEDYDLTYRIAERFKSINLPINLYFYRQLSSGVSKKIEINSAISQRLVAWLGAQRQLNGEDAVDSGDSDSIARFVESVSMPYKKDASLIYREYAASFMYNRLYASAICSSIKSIQAEPFKVNNYRTLLYCLRKSFF